MGTSSAKERRRGAALPRLFQQIQDEAQVARSGHEREEDAQGAVRGGAQQGPQLGAEGLGGAAHEAQGALAQGGVGAGGPARAPGPRDRRPTSAPSPDGGHLLEQPPVDLVLALLVRPAPRAPEQVLRAEEADPLRAVLQRRAPPPPGTPRWPRRATRVPSRVTQGRTRASARGRTRRSPCPARRTARAGSPGSITTAPCEPSTATVAPAGMRVVASCRPTTAGMPKERARIDV